MKKRVIVCGGCGRMASLVADYIQNDPELKLVGIIESPTHPYCGKDWGEVLGKGRVDINVESDLEKIIDQCDVVVEFTIPEATIAHSAISAAHKKAMLIGTTGLSGGQVREIEQASKFIPIMLSPNMSLGVNLLFELVKKAASVLDESYDVEIIETHHHFKKDAPSGTALKIAEVIAQERNINLKDEAIYGRAGEVGQRKTGEIGIHAVRAGNISGEHTIIFNSLGERLELTHKAYSRDAFAEGALKAVHFILNKEAGLFSMKDVLKL